MEGYDDPFNRRPYHWYHSDMELLKYVTTLGTFRKSEPLLQRGQLRLLYADATCLVFARYDDTRAVLFYINRGETRCTVRLTAADGVTDICTLLPLSGLYRTADATAADGTIEVLRVDLPTD